MPKKLTRAQVKRFLNGRHVAVLATIGNMGEPVLTPIWYLYRDGKILMRTARPSPKAKHIERDPRVTVCVQEESPPYVSVTVYGSATIEPEEPGLGAKMARHYLGALGGAAYMRTAADEIEREGGEVTIVITPERTISQDFSAEVPAVGKVWLKAKRILPPQL